jgi:hypothetical protein
MGTSDKAHAKLSASGADRWMSCPGSVALIEQAPPQKDNVWGIEGTLGHSVMEAILKGSKMPDGISPEMMENVSHMVRFVRKEAKKDYSTLLVEEKVQMPESIGPDMFGTLDSAVVQPFGELHIIDFKYGTSPVDSVENMQLTYYAIGIAHTHGYEFDRVKFTIVQPRSRQFSGKPQTWVTDSSYLKRSAKLFAEGVKRTKYKNAPLQEGKYCYWCPAQGICPLKAEKRIEKARSYFD